MLDPEFKLKGLTSMFLLLNTLHFEIMVKDLIFVETLLFFHIYHTPYSVDCTLDPPLDRNWDRRKNECS